MSRLRAPRHVAVDLLDALAGQFGAARGVLLLQRCRRGLARGLKWKRSASQ
jgi:hypothetical protein